MCRSIHLKSRTRLSDFIFTFHCHALEKEMAAHSSVHAWRIPGTAEPGGLLSIGLQSWTQLKRLNMHACTGEGNGNPLQCSCLENPRDGGAWWAAVYGATQSRTRLKQLSNSSSRLNGHITFCFSCPFFLSCRHDAWCYRGYLSYI